MVRSLPSETGSIMRVLLGRTGELGAHRFREALHPSCPLPADPVGILRLCPGVDGGQGVVALSTDSPVPFFFFSGRFRSLETAGATVVLKSPSSGILDRGTRCLLIGLSMRNGAAAEFDIDRRFCSAVPASCTSGEPRSNRSAVGGLDGEGHALAVSSDVKSSFWLRARQLWRAAVSMPRGPVRKAPPEQRSPEPLQGPWA